MAYTIRQLSEYLYKVKFKSLTPTEPTNYNLGGCSSFVRDGKLYRNFDWDFSEDLTFSIQCPDFKGTAFGKMSDIESLPYKIVDGCNNHGIMIATHILFNDWGWNGDGDIPLYKLPYIALTTMQSINDVYNLPLDNLSQIPMLAEKEYLAQFIVTDGETTYILSPDTESNNYIVQDATNNPKLANFYWVDEETVDRSDLQNRPTGVERWNLMPCDLADIAFTKAYESPNRLSEFIGINGTTKDSTDEELTAIYNKAHQLYSHRIRDGKTWQTMHSVVYGSDGIEEFHTQENWNRNYAREIMSDLPNPNQSRTESYLGVIIEQEGAVKPPYPLSRVEQYLEFIIEQGVPSGRAGSKVILSIDPSTYVMTLNLLNKDDEIISTTSVDLPLEEMIVSGRYDATTKKLILTLKNGEVIEIPVGDIISGLQSQINAIGILRGTGNGNVVAITIDESLSFVDGVLSVSSALIQQLTNAITTEVQARLADSQELRTAISTEAADRAAQIRALADTIADEFATIEYVNGVATSLGTRIGTIEGKEAGWDAKQNAISDLETIRSGAAAGATAVQDSSYVHTDNNYDNTAKAKVEAAIDKTVNDLINYYLKSDTYTKTEVNALIAAIRQFTYVLAPSLPEASASTLFKIYLIPSERAKTDNVKDEFITIDNGEGAADRYTWEQIGSTAVDLSGYYTKAEVDAMFARAITYEVQNLTDAQKVQARRNIGAASIDTFVRNALIGGVTKDQYNDLMKEWFLENGCLVMTDLTQLVQKWYSITRIGWNGGTKFSATTESSVSTGTAIGDNVGLNCTPSTNTVAGTDNYASLPMFAIKDANVTLDADGDPHVTAIEGIPSANAFARYDTTKVVEVLQMAPWMKYSEDATSYSWEYTDEIGKTGYIPWPSAVSLKNNSVRTWVHHVKYPFGDGYTACSGQKVRVWDVSHNSQLTGVRTAWGNKYCGKTSSDDGWVKHMTMIKYKSLTLDNIMNGCLSYYYNTVHPAIAEEDVERVIVAKSTGNAWLVGSTICVGSSAYGGKSTQCSVVDRAKIVSIEDVEIEGTVYSAVNLDNGGVKFNTTTELFVTTMQWYTGSTDNVLGNDGSPYSNTSTKEPYKIQGIEQIVGCYEVMGDTILSYIDGYQVPHVCRDASKLATSITADYKRCSFGYPQPAASAWTYSKKLGFDSNLPELLYPSESGGSSSTFTRDGYYIDGTSTVTSALREWLAFGCLDRGLPNGGLSCLYGLIGLAGTGWNIGGRLSSNGNRGEFEPSAA